MMYTWKGHASPSRGWRYSKETDGKLDERVESGIQTPNPERPRLKRYLDEMPGVPSQEMSGRISTRLTLTPRSAWVTPRKSPKPCLSESSRPAATRATSFSIPSAGAARPLPWPNSLKRRWIGIDITYLAINLVQRRLRDSFAERPQPL